MREIASEMSKLLKALFSLDIPSACLHQCVVPMTHDVDSAACDICLAGALPEDIS